MNTHEYKKESQKNKFMNCSLEKWGRAPIILWGMSTHLFEGSSTHYLGGLEHSFLRGREHSLFQGGTPALNNVALLEYSFVHNNNCPVRTLKHLLHKNCISNNLAKVT